LPSIAGLQIIRPASRLKRIVDTASLCRSGAYVATRAAGRAPMRGLAQPSAVACCAVALSFVSGWRAFSSVSLCRSIVDTARLAGLASLGPPSSQGRPGSSALPFAGATRPCVGRARTSRRVPLAGLRCAVSPGPRLGLFAPGFVSGWRAFSSVSLCKSIVYTCRFFLSVDFFGRLGAPALTLLGDLADQAVQAGGPGLSRAAFISGALRELRVALCRGNASLCRSGAYVATRAAGWTPMRGLAQSSAEVV
jgi:hypothetical protein